MNLTIAIFIGLSIAIAFLFFYMFERDKELDRKFHLISDALENINQEIFKIQNQQKKNSLQNMDLIISDKLNDIVQNLVKMINNNQTKNKDEISVLYDKIEKLEKDMKALSLPNFKTIDKKENDKERVKKLFDIGYSIEEISKETGIPIGEVHLLLKF